MCELWNQESLGVIQNLKPWEAGEPTEQNITQVQKFREKNAKKKTRNAEV